MDGKSLDLVEVNRRAVMEALKGVAPEVVSESGVDLEKLAILIGEDKNLSDKLERYNFTWSDKRKAIKSALTPSSGTLRPAPKESVNWDNTKNLYIEGDNLEVLKLLQKSYFGKIKMIYIDPPYNTGKEFVYPDDYADNIQNYLELTGQINESGRRITTNTETSGRYHTNWLNMMYPRLKLARNLLRDDGVIFISIDDHEVSNLRKICDEIFGEENFRNQIVVRRGAKSVQAQFETWDKLGQDTEYILFYTKNSEFRFPKQYKKLGNIKTGTWNNHWRGTDRPTMRYSIFGIIPQKGQWRWSEMRSLIAIKNYEKLLSDLGESPESITQEKIDAYYTKLPEKIDLLRLSKAGKPEHYVPPSDETLLNTSWYDLLVGSSNEISDLFETKVFDTSKLTSIVIRMLGFCDKDSIILDFFSGSATTAHAVMELNKEDGGNRQFIMVQLPEPCGKDTEAFKAGYKNICEIGKERIRRVIKKIEAEYAESEKSTQGELDLGAPAKQKPDLGFKVFKLDTSNFIPWDSNPDNLSEESLQRSLSNIKLDRSQQDLLYELFLKLGVTLNTPYQKVELAGKYMYDIGYGSIYACLDDDLDMDFCKAMIAYHDAQFPKEESTDKKEERELEKYRLETTTFIFRDSSFADDNIKTNILQTLRQMGLTNIRAI
mgnify:FL=1